MNKIKVFLDTSVLIKMLNNGSDDFMLFSKEILEKVEYIINPIVFQELLFIVEKTDNKEKFKSIEQCFEIVPIESQGINSDFRKKMSKLRNYGLHSNDALILETVKETECDYLLTYDKKMINASQEESFTVVTPHNFLESINEKATWQQDKLCLNIKNK